MSPSPALAAKRSRTDAGWLFAASFRPFFLGASLLAAGAVPAWIWIRLAGPNDVGGMPALSWHVHEMVFGFLPAVMTGYLLSSTPNWSGRLPVSGWPLAGLFAFWLAGRLVPLAGPPLLWAALADAAFPLAVAAVLTREARVRSPRQSRHGLILFPVLAAASVAHRYFAADHETAALLARVGIAVAALLIAAVGGRLVPSLTRNALAGRGAERVPAPYGRFDIATLLVASVALAAWVAAPFHGATAVLMAVAGLLHGGRLSRWRGWLLRQPDLLALHAGYAWLVASMLLAALAADPLALVLPDAAMHGFTAGAIGCMTMAVMARLSLTRGAGDRTDQILSRAALAAVNLGAGTRVAAAILLDHRETLLGAGAALWSLGFLVFALAQVARQWRTPES